MSAGAPLRVLHLASFDGNAGDVANHLGFRPWFERLAGHPVGWTSLEMREFYWKRRAFDASFVDFVNEHDLLVVGGGNYFELWVDESPTGTSFGVPFDDFKRIRTPIFFNALGVDAGQGASTTAIGRFKTFLDLLLDGSRYLVSVRNDGARATLSATLGHRYADAVLALPDAGFFAPWQPWAPEPDTTRVGVNLACDMANVRFRNFSGGYRGFCEEIARALRAVVDDRAVDLTFFAHTYHDLSVISDVIGLLPDDVRRRQVSAAPFGPGERGARALFDSYRRCTAVIAARFHANVCAIGMGVPTIGLNTYSQIAFLYEELGAPHGAVDASRPGFAEELTARTAETIADPRELASMMTVHRASVAGLRRAAEPRVRQWLAEQGWTET